nr:hypothetical protein I308_02842 [Cryptococcus tetragattii IND107]
MGKDVYCATTTVSPCARKCGGKGDAGDQLDGISRDYQPRSRNAAEATMGLYSFHTYEFVYPTSGF